MGGCSKGRGEVGDLHLESVAVQLTDGKAEVVDILRDALVGVCEAWGGGGGARRDERGSEDRCSKLRRGGGEGRGGEERRGEERREEERRGEERRGERRRGEERRGEERRGEERGEERRGEERRGEEERGGGNEFMRPWGVGRPRSTATHRRAQRRRRRRGCRSTCRGGAE